MNFLITIRYDTILFDKNTLFLIRYDTKISEKNRQRENLASNLLSYILDTLISYYQLIESYY